MPAELARLLAETPELARAFLVGGCVRDALLGLAVKDFDVEVFGVSYERLARALKRWGRVDFVGQSFGVAKLTTGSGLAYDFAIPRRDRKVALGHKGFAVEFDADITPQEAASRRDFTINALMFDPRRGEVLDFFGGQEDLCERVLRHTSAAFVEDPLRVLRGMQFASRFNLRAAPETIALCRSIKASFGELAVERVGDEWFKWAVKSAVPSVGLRFLADTEWIEHFPEIAALRGTPQDPEWHPEGDVFTHTAHCCDALVKLPEWQAADEAARIAWMLAVLAHDFGKPAVTHEALRDGRMRIVSPGHEEGGVEPALRFLERIHAPHAIRDRVPPLVANHLAHLQPVTDRAVRRLAKRLEPETIAGLCVIVTADHNGRPPKPLCVPEGVKALLAKAEELRVQDSAPKPILQGRHLIAAGMKPGKEFKAILHEAFEAQLEGQFGDLEGAQAWLRNKLGG
ncbi:MAG: tRNA nucleotidyltransferase (CCA-adding enzyme) [Limisphaerales bacterium]|nr:MAG: tRNA nucleotidyltransferase (CCA-adding enzyme) [Limisphaerales bacterium]KAG0506784.1 MAG: tRNA nucleotidyltransferase (CCA-adding enzyme) [Limisphaerales bacterium]TXT49230.1 MAG: tRNA nucleotidyltransferase (CCA-adding enzyme) [Limisphaerales bacterium]